MGSRRRFLAALGSAAATSCAGALRRGTANNPFHAPQPDSVPAPTPPYTGWVQDFGFWLNASPDTRPFTTFVTYALDIDEESSANTLQIDDADARRIVWFVSLFSYGPTPRSRNGYSLRPDYVAGWNRVKDIIGARLDRTRAIWLMDEPDSVAWGDKVPGELYTPNLYNDDIVRAAALMHANFPDVAIGLNYGGVPADLTIPSSITLVGLEAYGDRWRSDVAALKRKTGYPIWLLAPGYISGDPDALDAPTAQRVRDQVAYAHTDPQIRGFYPFLWHEDDTTTSTRDFYTVYPGGRLPQTTNVLMQVGAAIREGRNRRMPLPG